MADRLFAVMPARMAETKVAGVYVIHGMSPLLLTTRLARSACPESAFVVSSHRVKTVSFNQMKRQEAQSRMAAIRKARRNPAAAAALQRRASLVGAGAKWRIINLDQVARAIAKWA